MVLSINVGLTSKFHVEREVTTKKQTTKKTKLLRYVPVLHNLELNPFLQMQWNVSSS